MWARITTRTGTTHYRGATDGVVAHCDGVGPGEDQVLGRLDAETRQAVDEDLHLLQLADHLGSVSALHAGEGANVSGVRMTKGGAAELVVGKCETEEDAEGGKWRPAKVLLDFHLFRHLAWHRQRTWFEHKVSKGNAGKSTQGMGGGADSICRLPFPPPHPRRKRFSFSTIPPRRSFLIDHTIS